MFDSLMSQLPYYLCRIPALLLAISVHETAHGYVAYKLGDPTAKEQGRLTLNPLKHLDPIGALMMILVGFGWASPVPVNTRYFKNPKAGMAVTALAGPVSNLLLAFLGMFIYALVIYYTPLGYSDSSYAYVIVLLFEIFIMLNISLAVFNLIPIPPLDGSRILLTFLPQKAYFEVMRYERYLMLALLLLTYIDIPGTDFNIIMTPMNWAVTHIWNGMADLIFMLPLFG